MPLDDEDPEKWQYKEHTEVKHRILRKYLSTWTKIRSSTNSILHYFDGFAGRAIYEGERRGSPLLALEVADQYSDSIDKFLLTFNEYRDNNYNDLKKGVTKNRRKSADNICIDFENDRFEDVALDVMTNPKYRDVPSLVFIDPFGYDDAPFDTVSNIMNIREQGDEIFFTFMVGKMRRFIGDESKAGAISRVLGTEDWKYIREYDDKERKENEILKLYVSQLENEAGIEHVFPFRMMHPERRLTAYYLVHATNHFKGMKVMKDVMFREGAEGHFAYLGQDHYGFEEDQMNLFESTGTKDNRITELETHLLETFDGEQHRFWDIMKESYADTNLITKHYREAIENLAERDKVQIYNHPERSDGSETGLGDDDEVEFVEQNQRLSKWV